MASWKSSTILVVAAFSVSVLLLFLKADMASERRRDAPPARVSNQIYSPGAADPELRTPERAEQIRRAGSARAVSTSSRTPAEPARRGGDAPAARPPSPAIPEHDVPAGHEYYVVTATLTSPESALKGLAEMKRKGLTDAFVGTFDDGKYYPIIGNTYAREDQARLLVAELAEKHGIEAYVYHKKD